MTTGTINGLALERCTIRIPRWGNWVADCSVLSGDTLSGHATIVIGGQSFVGAVVAGGVYRERGTYRVVGGAGRWATSVRARSYANGAGVKLSTVVKDAASDAGEQLGAITDRRLGPSFVRPEGPASRVLDLVAPEGWYVDAAGVTVIGSRPGGSFTLPALVVSETPGRGLVTLAAESIAGLFPGVAVGGVVAATVRHELTPSALRTHVAASQAGLTDRTLEAVRRLVLHITRPHWFHGVYEYRVASVSGGYLDVVPADSRAGLPDLGNVPMRVGSPGGGGDPAEGSSVLVGFINGDATRPYVCGYEGEGLDGWVPDVARLTSSGRVFVGGAEPSNPATATGRFIRWGDQIPHPVSGVPLSLVPHPSNLTMSRAGSS